MTAAHATTGSQTVTTRDRAIAADASLRPQTGERQGNPVQVRNGPAAVRGDAPNVEAIAGYRPDVVIVSGDANDGVGGLGKLGIRVLVQPAATNLAEAYEEIVQLGAVTGHTGSAAALVRRMRKSITKVVRV